MSSRFFRTRSNGAIFKSGPVHNMKHITPISRIEWTLMSEIEQFKFKLEEIIGIQKHAGKVRNKS